MWQHDFLSSYYELNELRALHIFYIIENLRNVELIQFYFIFVTYVCFAFTCMTIDVLVSNCVIISFDGK